MMCLYFLIAVQTSSRRQTHLNTSYCTYTLPYETNRVFYAHLNLSVM